MVQPVSRNEELERSSNSVFSARQEELEAMADKMPARLNGRFPYLMEKSTGVIHPYTEAMAERSDLVIGCYNLEGSRNPEDADPYYDPQAIVMREDRLRRIEELPPQSAAEVRAQAAETAGRIRREERERADAELEQRLEGERERIRQELLAEMAGNTAAPAEVATEKKAATKGAKGGKGGKAAKAKDTAQPEAKPPVEPEAAQVADNASTPAPAEAGSGENAGDLDAAFQQVMSE